MANLLHLLNNELAPQRTIAFFKRQEARIERLNKTYDLNLKYTDLARKGLDMLLDELENQLASESKKTSKLRGGK
jgi:two-component sensor histidine kinase